MEPLQSEILFNTNKVLESALIIFITCRGVMWDLTWFETLRWKRKYLELFFLIICCLFKVYSMAVLKGIATKQQMKNSLYVLTGLSGFPPLWKILFGGGCRRRLVYPAPQWGAIRSRWCQKLTDCELGWAGLGWELRGGGGQAGGCLLQILLSEPQP